MLSLGTKPRGLSLGYNILLLFQRTCAFYVLLYPKFLARGKRAKGMHADGIPAVLRVTSVNPGACNKRLRWVVLGGSSSIQPRLPEVNWSNLCRETLMHLLNQKVCICVHSRITNTSSVWTVWIYVDPYGNCLSRNPENHHRETLSSLLSLFGKPVSVFPVVCGGHAEMDYSCLDG